MGQKAAPWTRTRIAPDADAEAAKTTKQRAAGWSARPKGEILAHFQANDAHSSPFFCVCVGMSLVKNISTRKNSRHQIGGPAHPLRTGVRERKWVDGGMASDSRSRSRSLLSADQRISGSAVDGAPTEEPRPDASNARSQRPATRAIGVCLVLFCLCVKHPWLPTGVLHCPGHPSCAGA
jgi:hypothetical protein